MHCLHFRSLVLGRIKVTGKVNKGLLKKELGVETFDVQVIRRGENGKTTRRALRNTGVTRVSLSPHKHRRYSRCEISPARASY